MKSPEAGKNAILKVLDDGSALSKFTEMIIAQGTCPTLAKDICDKNNDPFSYLPKATFQTDLRSNSTGKLFYVYSPHQKLVCTRL